MNPRYKNGILLFGAVLPALIVLLVFGVLFSQKSRVNKEYDKRKAVLSNNILAERQAVVLKAQLALYDARKSSWDNLLKSSDVGAVTSLLKSITTEYSVGDRFKQDAFNSTDREIGIGAVSAQPSVTYNIALSGTYKTLQESMLTLESTMPNLSLNSMDLVPQKEGQLLEAKLSYSAWIN